MKYNFVKEQEMADKLTSLLDRWNVCYNIFFKIIKDELPLEPKDVADKLKKRDFDAIFDDISEMSGVLENVHNYLQDLGSIYTQMWRVVNDIEDK